MVLGVTGGNNIPVEADLVPLGWKVPRQAKEDFVAFCTRVGTRYQEDCAGALVIWQSLPPQVRERAKLRAKGEALAQAQSLEEEIRDLVAGARADAAKQRQSQAHDARSVEEDP